MKKRSCSLTRLILGCSTLLLIVAVFFVGNRDVRAILRRHERLFTARTRPQTTKPNAAPFMVYRDENENVRLCVIPRLCSVEYNGGKKDFYLPIEYKPFEAMIQDCLIYPKSTVKYYRGERPEGPDVTYFDVDVLGHSLLSMWDGHFAHLIISFVYRILAPASLTRSGVLATLPQPRCFYPNSNTPTPCSKHQQNRIRPRILVSRYAFKHKWVRGLLRLVESGVTDGKGPLVQVIARKRIPNENTFTKRTECYRSLITTPKMFRASISGHDRLLRNAKVEREPKCFSRVLLLTRVPYPGRIARTIPDKTIAAVRKEVARLSDVEIDWRHGLTRTNFSEQVAMFQRADVVVAVKGAELSNGLFLRRGARVIELFPFIHYTTYFYYSTIIPVGAKHVPFGTRPDPEPFYECLKRKGIDADGALKARYDNFAEQYRSAKTFHQRNKIALSLLGSGRVDSCMRSQVIRFDPADLARVIVQQARERCEEIKR